MNENLNDVFGKSFSGTTPLEIIVENKISIALQSTFKSKDKIDIFISKYNETIGDRYNLPGYEHFEISDLTLTVKCSTDRCIKELYKLDSKLEWTENVNHRFLEIEDERHILLWCNSCSALTLFEYCYGLWNLDSGSLLQGSLWKKGYSKIKEESLLKIKEWYYLNK